MMLVCLGQIFVTNPLPCMWGTCELPGDHSCAVATDTCIRIKKCQLGCQKHSICTQHVCICRLGIGFCIIQDKNQTASLGGMLMKYLASKKRLAIQTIGTVIFPVLFCSCSFQCSYILHFIFSICLRVLTRRTSKHVM